jgi:hypothetical protein
MAFLRIPQFTDPGAYLISPQLAWIVADDGPGTLEYGPHENQRPALFAGASAHFVA